MPESGPLHAVFCLSYHAVKLHIMINSVCRNMRRRQAAGLMPVKKRRKLPEGSVISVPASEWIRLRMHIASVFAGRRHGYG